MPAPGRIAGVGRQQGFGYGAYIGLAFGIFGAYAGFDHVPFDCETTSCGSDGEYTLQGATVGLKLTRSGSARTTVCSAS